MDRGIYPKGLEPMWPRKKLNFVPSVKFVAGLSASLRNNFFENLSSHSGAWLTFIKVIFSKKLQKSLWTPIWRFLVIFKPPDWLKIYFFTVVFRPTICGANEKKIKKILARHDQIGEKLFTPSFQIFKKNFYPPTLLSILTQFLTLINAVFLVFPFS